MEDQPKRNRPIHLQSVERGNQPVIQFITVCTNKRKPILGNSEAHHLLVEIWQTSRDWQVGKYVLMPDHLHLFCSPKVYPIESLAGWITHWKRVASKNWPKRSEKPVWQTGFWDTQLRPGQSYMAKWKYMLENPIRAELVRREDNWEFSGTLNDLPWLE